MLLCWVLSMLMGQPPPGDAFPERHLEPIESSHEIRVEQYRQLKAYADGLVSSARDRRAEFFTPDYSSIDAYTASVRPFREKLCERIGYPPPLAAVEKTVRLEPVGEDGYATIYRVWITVLDGVEAYSILWIPKGLTAPAPLLICQHGGGGNPELLASFQGDAKNGATNYGWMVQRGLQAGFVCWAPSLIFPYQGKEDVGPDDRVSIDKELRYVGTSIVAVELYKIHCGVDEMLKRPEVDPGKVAMIGLSYGGQYTLYYAALDERVQAAVSSCYFNRREDNAWPDWSYFNYFNEFTDAELCGLICPRALIVEVGEKDTLFTIDGARATAPDAAVHWERLGIPERFRFAPFPGGHEFWGEGAYEFLKANLK